MSIAYSHRSAIRLILDPFLLEAHVHFKVSEPITAYNIVIIT